MNYSLQIFGLLFILATTAAIGNSIWESDIGDVRKLALSLLFVVQIAVSAGIIALKRIN